MISRARQIGAVIILCLLLIFGTTTHFAVAQSGPAYELIQALNQFRAQHGLSALQADPSLMAAAQRHASWMIVTQHFGHTGEGGSTPQSRATAAGYAGTVFENYEAGTALTAQGAVYWWQQDSIHLNTMLLPTHVHVGVGFGSDGEQNVFVLMVGKPSKPAPTARSTTAPRSVAPTDPPVLLIPIVVNTPGDDGSVTHVVQQGQTAWAIAARYGIDLADLLALNNLKSGDLLHPGDQVVIRLARGQAPPPTPTLPLAHVVQQGETLWEIAVRNGIALDDLLALNNLTRGAVLRPGDTVILRKPAPTATVTPSPEPTETATVAPSEPAPAVSVMSTAVSATGLPTPSSLPPTPTLSPATDPGVEDNPLPVLLLVAIALFAVLISVATGLFFVVRRDSGAS